jgi:hypothetical protein
MKTPAVAERYALGPHQNPLTLLLQLTAVAGVWASILIDSYFGRVALTLFILAAAVGVLSQLAYRYLLPHRLTPFVVSHVLCLAWYALQGGLLSSTDPVSGGLNGVLFIASGPFAYSSGWQSGFQIMLSPVFLTASTASVLGFCFRPNWLTAHLFSTASVYWHACGYVLLVFAGLGT